MMDPTPRNLPEEERHYWERLYESALVELLKRGWKADEAANTAALVADDSVKLHQARFSK